MRYRIQDSVLHTQLEDESVFLNLDSGHYFSTNSVGSRIWTLLLDGPRTVEELLTVITQEYIVSDETAEQDLRELLQDLVKHGLLETQNEQAGS